MAERWIWFNVVAPRWRAPFRPPPGLGSRPWLRWQVVREIRPIVHADGIVSSGYEHHSLHWTHRAAHRAAHSAQCEQRDRP